MRLGLLSRLAKQLGFEIPAWKKESARMSRIEARRSAYQKLPRQQALQHYPELAPVFIARDAALSFYSDVLQSLPTDIYTNQRNKSRAELIADEALKYVDEEKEVPPFKRAGRHREAQFIRLEEIRAIRKELEETFDSHARVDANVRQESYRKYALWRESYNENEKETPHLYSELNPLIQLKKQAKRVYKEYIKTDFLDATINHCIDQALKDLARGFPVMTIEEIKAHAMLLQDSDIGLTGMDRGKYQFFLDGQPQEFSYLRNLIGRSGVKTGWWPYAPNLYEEADRIKQLDSHLKRDLYYTVFHAQEREEVLQKYPELQVVYKKLDAAVEFFSQKVDGNKAAAAAKEMISPDFQNRVENKALRAVIEYTDQERQEFLERANQAQKTKLHETTRTAEMIKRKEKLIVLQGLQAANEMTFDKEDITVIINGKKIRLDRFKERVMAVVREETKQEMDAEAFFQDTVSQLLRASQVNETDQQKIKDYLNYDASQNIAPLPSTDDPKIEQLLADAEVISMGKEKEEEKVITVNGREKSLAQLKKEIELTLEKTQDPVFNRQKSLEQAVEDYLTINMISPEDQIRLKDYFAKQEDQEKKEKAVLEKVIINAPKNQTRIEKRLLSTAPALNLDKIFNTELAITVHENKKGQVRWNKEAIFKGLDMDIENLATHLLGEPNPKTSTATEMHFGSNKGSLIIQIGDKDRGFWYDHQVGIGGKPIKLIMHSKDLDYKQALDFAGDYLGLTPETPYPYGIDMTDLNDIPEQKQKTVSYARQLLHESQNIQGTLAEKYLRQRRGISIPIPATCRFHPAVYEKETQTTLPALVVASKDLMGRVVGAQVIYLDLETATKANLEVNKRSYGFIKGSSAAIHQGGNILAVAEGVETALSIANADPNLTVFASLGHLTNFSAIPFEAKGHTVIVCQDNDPGGNESNRRVEEASDELAKRGFNVLLTKPMGEVKSDFNDILLEQGISAVKQYLQEAKLFRSSEKKINNSIKTSMENETSLSKENVEIESEI